MNKGLNILLRFLLFCIIAFFALGMFKVVKKGVIQQDSLWIYLLFCSFWGLLLWRDFKSKQKNKIKKEEYNVENERKYNQVFLSLVSHLLGSNSSSKDKEFEFIQSSFLRFFSQKKTEHLLARLVKDHLENKLDLEALCIAARSEFSPNELDQMIYLLVGISTADKVLSNAEEKTLLQIVKFTYFSEERYESILAQFQYKTEEYIKNKKDEEHWDNMNWEERGKYHQEKERQRFDNKKPAFGIDQAFRILELQPSATLKQVKKKFKKLAMKYHPDRLSQLGEDHIRIGEEKFKQIVNAYEILKSHLGN